MKLYKNRKDKKTLNESPKEEKKVPDDQQLELSIMDNLDRIKQDFHFHTNEDFHIRKVFIKSLNDFGFIINLAGAIDTKAVESNIITPLIKETIELSSEDILDDLIDKLFTASDVKKLNSYDEISDAIITGKTVLLIDKAKHALGVDTIGFKHRNIEKPQNETVIKGPQEAFVESAVANRSLIRKQIKTKDLITETIYIGETTLSNVSIMYIKGVTNPDLIEQVKARIKQIKADSIIDSATLEQHLEERPYSPVPSLLYTERPDRAAAFLREGYVVLLSDYSPSCLIAPVTFWSFFHSPSDQYDRWIFGNFVRLLRVFSFLIALLTPALYIAITNYHSGMIPFDLLLSIAATREVVPFPSLVEVLIMEISFELIREAGIRIPSPIGPTIGIIGALILGQAAVEANIVSPILVIVVSITGLGSFSIPNYASAFAIRVSRFLFLLAAATMGLFGVNLLAVSYIVYLVSCKSFGVYFFTPIAPHYDSSVDTFIRAPIFKQYLRPLFLYPLDKIRKLKSED